MLEMLFPVRRKSRRRKPLIREVRRFSNPIIAGESAEASPAAAVVAAPFNLPSAVLTPFVLAIVVPITFTTERRAEEIRLNTSAPDTIPASLRPSCPTALEVRATAAAAIWAFPAIVVDLPAVAVDLPDAAIAMAACSRTARCSAAWAALFCAVTAFCVSATMSSACCVAVSFMVP